MVTDYGMSDKLGPRTFGDKQELVFLGREISEQRDYSERIALQIDKEVDSLIQEAYKVAQKILTENKPKLTHIAQKLIAQETIEGKELEALFDTPVDSPLPETAPTPAEPTTKAKTKTKPVSKRKRAPPILQPLPKQAPATPD